MVPSSFIGLANNAAYLLALVLLYDVFARKNGAATLASLLLQGIFLGGIGIAVMSAPWVMQPGATFDTRSVVLSLGGLFFGLIPTATAIIIVSGFRFLQGGVGVFTGISVIITSGLIGLLWQRRWRVRLKDITALEMYFFGVVVAINMLLLMLTLPSGVAHQVLKNISLPVLLIYPVATLLIGALVRDRLIRQHEHGALQQSEERLRAFYELNLVGLAITSPEKGWLNVNQGLCAMLGYQEDELKAMTWAELTHPDDLDADIRQFNQLREGAITGYEMAKRYIAKDGAVVFTQLVVRCVRKQNGEIDYIVAMVEDLTRKKVLEKELVRKEDQFRFVVENQQDLVVSFDGAFRLLYANPAYCKAFAQTAEELAGINVLSLIPVENRDMVHTFLEQLHTPPHSTRFEELVVTSQGQRWFEWQMEATVENTGEIVATVAVARDITTRKETKHALQEHNLQMEELVAARTRDLADKNAELERLNKYFVDREFRIKELKMIIERLRNQ